MKQAVKPTERPRALDTLVGIVDLAVTFRFPEKTPSLADVARVVGARMTFMIDDQQLTIKAVNK